MERILKRLKIVLTGFGIVLVMFSTMFVPNFAQTGYGGSVEPQEYRTCLISLAGDVSINITIYENGSINFYLLKFEDALTLARTLNITATTPVLSRFNVSSTQIVYSGLLPTGLYTAVAETATNSTTFFEITIYRLLPEKNFVLLGSILFLAVLGITVIERLYKMYVQMNCQS